MIIYLTQKFEIITLDIKNFFKKVWAKYLNFTNIFFGKNSYKTTLVFKY